MNKILMSLEFVYHHLDHDLNQEEFDFHYLLRIALLLQQPLNYQMIEFYLIYFAEHFILDYDPLVDW